MENQTEENPLKIISSIEKDMEHSYDLLENLRSVSIYLAENANNLLLFLDNIQIKESQEGLSPYQISTDLKQNMVNIIQQYHDFCNNMNNFDIRENKEFTEHRIELTKLIQALKTLSRKVTAIGDGVNEMVEVANQGGSGQDDSELY